MRIIKKGNIVKKTQEYIKRCSYCKTIFTYTPYDIFFWFYATGTLLCPVCNRYNYAPLFKKKYKGDSNES